MMNAEKKGKIAKQKGKPPYFFYFFFCRISRWKKEHMNYKNLDYR
jgi:hypothetical protein